MKKPILILLTAVLVVALGLLPAISVAAATEIPEGATVDSAVLSVYVNVANGQTINVHRTTADWEENSVTWNSFGGSYDAAIAGSIPTTFVAGWYSVDITALVQDWVNGTYPNYGVLLEQGETPISTFYSSEYSDPSLRPKLDITYTAGGGSTTITIQRPGATQEDVADARIDDWYLFADSNFGWYTPLVTGLYSQGHISDSLIRFDIVPVQGGPGTGTPGYWKNHPEAWPVDEITIGGVVYTKDEAIAEMWNNKSKDKTYTMFAALVSAKLNVLNGSASDCIDGAIAEADEWMATYGPAGSGVEAGGSDSPWRTGEPLYSQLDDYNNGLLCATHRD